MRTDRGGAALAAGVAALLGGLLAAAEATAQGSGTVAGVIVPTGRQEYYVLGYDQHVWNMMQRVNRGVSGFTYNFQNGMNSVVSAVASADGQVVVYDHWEDTLEADPWAPVQVNTLVLGDGMSGNGRACDYTNDPRVVCGTATEDALYRGSPITLNSDQGLGGCAAGVRCTVPVNPRGTAVRFDGGDRLVTSGGPLALIHNQFPPPYPQIGGSTEVLPRQAFTGATSYYVPAGENSFTPGGPYLMFRYTAINLVAFNDATRVFVNSPGATGGTVSLTLNRGQHYTNCLTYQLAAPFNCTGGGIDGAAAPGLTINAATKISATGPVAILLFTGGATTPWATDFMPVVPDLLHGNDYILPTPGDDPTMQGSRPLNVYPYNPDSVNPISVTASDRTPRTSTIPLGPSATADYVASVGTIPPNSAVRLTSTRSFWGFALHDHLSPANDWGYSWLASSFLTNGYTVSFAPGVNNAATVSATSASRVAASGSAQCTIPPPGPGQCNSINRSPAFVSAALDNTLVKVDFNNDGLFDYIDTNSDDYPDNGAANDGTCTTPTAPWNQPGLTNCVYRIDALQVLRIYDYTDYDNTGTRVQASKPIAMAYGQDTDQATGPDDILDTGYTVYPLSQRFLDPVLVVGKVASPTVVAGATGGQTTFTITVRSYAFAPLTGLTVTDLLPPGLTAADYVAGSSLVTYPDLSQSTADPTPSIDGPTGRTRLTWALSPNTLGADQSLTVRFRVAIPAGPARTFSNETFATGVHAGRTFSAVGGADVVRADVSLTKLVTDDGSPEAGDVLTYTLLVRNNGASAETAVRLTDAVPAGTTFLAGSITAGAPFTGSHSAPQNAIVWTAASLPAGASATLTFQVRINADTDVGTVVPNAGIYESNETPTYFSNETQTVVVGPVLVETKTIVGGIPAVLHPLEVATFEIQIRNTGAGAATSVRITDALTFSSTTYVAGTMQYSLNGGAFVSVTDAADADAGSVSGTTVQLLLASLAPSADVRFRFQARIDSGTGGQVMNNQATVSADQVGTSDTNLVQVPIVGSATVVGRIFRDLDGDGVLDPGEPGLANATVLVTDAGSGFQHLVTTDAFGLYTVVVPPGATRLQVQTATLPPGFTLTTGAASEDQSPTAVAGTTIAAPTVANVGYSYPPLTVTKTSSAGGTVAPGQTVTYSVTVTNTGGTTLDNIQLNDPVPSGTTYVAASAQLATPVSPFRVTEYYIASGSFGGTVYDLTLNQNLAADFFVIVEPEGRADGGNDGPDVNYASLVAAGNGIGDLPAAGAANQIRLQRDDGASSWVGVVKVVECRQGCATAGFRLLGAELVSHAGAATAGTDTTAAWGDISRVMLVGGANGAGCFTADTTDDEHKNCHVRLWPSGTNSINWTRDGGGASLSTATSTVMVVEWGSDWTIQRTAVVNGNNGGADINAAGEYNTATVSPVLRSATWVWGTGHTGAEDVGDSAEGVALTLGDGTNPTPLPSVEGTIAAGIWFAGSSVNFDVYALSHPGLVVDHRFTGTNGGTTLAQAVSAASSPRMSLVYNALGTSSDDEYPASLLGARYTAAQPSASVTVERRRNVSSFAAWVQGIDFSAIYGQASAVCTGLNCRDPQTNPNVLPPSTYSLPPGGSLIYTYQVTVGAAPPPSLVSVVNTATATATGAGPAVASTTDTLVRPRVDVDPNNAGYANAGTTITFTHTVRNTGGQTDAYALTVTGERGWRVDLVDPSTGVVISSDTNADGAWDAGILNPSTGSLAPGGSKEYQVRVWVPGGATAGVQDTVRLRATSSVAPSVWDDAKDEITVLSSTLGSVIVTPDNSGVVQAGTYTAYAHRVINNTALADTFDFRAPGVTTGTGVDSSLGWTNTIHWDTNGDGVYTPGTDLQILNTAQLPPGGSQLVFVVVNAPGGTASGTRDVSHLTAWSRNNPDLFGAATDTSTVVTTPAHDLSGGGSRVVAPGQTAAFPGTVVNLGSAADRFEIVVTPSNLYGPGGDGLLHPTELWADTDADGVPDTRIAADTEGDGTWDVPPSAAWDEDGDGLPDVPVAGGGSFAYELRRPIDPNQVIQRDHVTLTSRSVANPATDPDNVTATWIFAAATRAGIKGLRIGPGEVAFATSTQSGTASFLLHQTDDPTGATGREPLHDQPVLSPVPDSITPVLYTVRTRPVERALLMIEETETDGDTVWMGPFAAGDARLARFLDEIERRLDAAGVPEGPVRWRRGYRRPPRAGAAGDGSFLRSGREGATRPGPAEGGGGEESPPPPPVEPLPRPGAARPGVRIEVSGGGWVRIPAAQLAGYGLPRVGPGAPLRLLRLGEPVPFSWQPLPGGQQALVFLAEALRTDYAGANAYLLTPPITPSPAVPLTRSADPATPGFLRGEREQLYVPSLPAGTDPWQWDILFSSEPWPNPDYDPAAGDFDLPGLAPGASGPAAVRLRVVGYTRHRHSFAASINGVTVGSVSVDGAGPALLTGTLPAETLRAAGNRLSIAYVGTALADSPAIDAFAYVDYVELAAPRSATAAEAAYTLSPWRPLLPNLRGVDYLIVTHPIFRAQADRIAGLKSAAGFTPAVVETTTAYDRFSGGIVEARAIQALVRFAARASSTLRHVLLVGDDSFDPLDHSGRGVPSFVPSLFARDSGWGLVPSENLYADTDDDGRPDVAIGRLPVRTAAEADAAADKIAAQDAAVRDLGGTHLAVADNSTESDAPFREDAQRALALLPEATSVWWADLAEGPAAARATLLAGWQSGVMATHYFGHGGLTEWADEQVLTTEDAAALGPGWKPTVLFTWACLSQYYLGVDGPSLNEALVLQPGGGAMASFGPAGITPPARQALLVERVYGELGVPGTSLGEAIRRAKAAAVASEAGAREVAEGFHLFGDPSLVLHRSAPVPR